MLSEINDDDFEKEDDDELQVISTKMRDEEFKSKVNDFKR